MTPQAETAIYNLLAAPVGRSAEFPVMMAMKQQIAQNLSNALVSIAPNVDFKQVFFPNQNPTTLSNLVPGFTNIQIQDWVNYANVIVCQGIYYWTSFSSSLNSTTINNQVTAYSSSSFVNTGYLGITAVSQNAQIVNLANAAIAQGASKSDLITIIIKIIPSRILLYQDKQWVNGDLEIFDWLGKYLAMAGTIGEIPGLLTQFYNHDLPQYPNLSPTTIVNYKGYMTRSTGPTYNDFPELQGPMTYSPDQCTIGWTGQHICLVNTDMYSSYYISNAQMSQNYLAPSSCCAEDTEILLADGTSKLITKLSPEDIIQGASEPVLPLYVSKTPLHCRKLYEFFALGVGPRLTDTHPIVNPDQSSKVSNEPAVLAVSPGGLRQILPNHNRTGVGALIANQSKVKTIKVVANKKRDAETETIQALRVTDTSGHGKYVYDIVLPFSGNTQPGYWAGRNGKFVLIEPELIRLKDDHYVGVAIFELLTGLAEALEKGEWKVSSEADEIDIRTYLNSYGVQIMSLALRTALSNISADTTKVVNLDQLGPAIDAFVRQGWMQHPDLIADIAVILETVTKFLYVPMSNLIRNGWRYLPKTELLKEMSDGYQSGQKGEYLVVTIMDLELTSPIHFEGASTKILNAEISPFDPKTNETVKVAIASNFDFTNSIFRHTYDQHLVYKMADENDQPTLKIDLAFSPDGVSWAATKNVPLPTGAFSHRYAMLFDCHGVEVAKIHFDVRRLTESQLDLDVSQRTDWGEKNQLAFAASLGKELVASISFALSKCQKVMAKRPLHLIDA